MISISYRNWWLATWWLPLSTLTWGTDKFPLVHVAMSSSLLSVIALVIIASFWTMTKDSYQTRSSVFETFSSHFHLQIIYLGSSLVTFFGKCTGLCSFVCFLGKGNPGESILWLHLLWPFYHLSPTPRVVKTELYFVFTLPGTCTAYSPLGS